MALDATPGGATANSYATRAAAQSYWADRGFDHSGHTGEEIDAALIRATAWLDGRYRTRFPGERANGRGQALEWPRDNATDVAGNDIADDAIPAEIVAATVEAARHDLQGLNLSPSVTPSQVVVSKRVGPIAKTFAASAAVSQSQPVLAAVDNALSSLLRGSGRTRFVDRA